MTQPTQFASNFFLKSQEIFKAKKALKQCFCLFYTIIRINYNYNPQKFDVKK